MVRNLKQKSQTYDNNNNTNTNNNNNNKDKNDNNIIRNMKEDNDDDAFIDGGACFVSKTVLSLWDVYCKIRKSGT